MAHLSNEQSNRRSRKSSDALLESMRFNLHFQLNEMRFLLTIKGNTGRLQPRKETLEHKPILQLNDLTNSLSCEQMLVALNHIDQPLNLLLVLLTNLLIALDLELKTARLVDPVRPLTPCRAVAKLLKHLLELKFGRVDILLLRINNEIVVLGQHRHQRRFLLFRVPRQLLQKTKQFALVDCVAFS
jgi:hypothetical protein